MESCTKHEKVLIEQMKREVMGEFQTLFPCLFFFFWSAKVVNFNFILQFLA